MITIDGGWLHLKNGAPVETADGVLSTVFFLMLFGNIGRGWGFIVVFAASYLLWDITFGVNDIGYWTLLPAMTQDQAQRERCGAFARICANVGMYIVMVAWEPVTSALGNTPRVWFCCAAVIAAVYLLGLLFPLLGVKEKRAAPEQQEATTLMLMFLADTVEYGQWKLKKRNESVTFSIQPLVNKIGGALSTGFISLTLILSGIKTGEQTADVIGSGGKLIVKLAMFVIPLLFIIAGYVIYRKKYKISEEFYRSMLAELEKTESPHSEAAPADAAKQIGTDAWADMDRNMAVRH